MNLEQLQVLAIDIKSCYREVNERDGHRNWTARDYADGLVVDVADLTKMLMVQDDLRHGDGDTDRIAHELGDIVWSAFVIADELGIDLAQDLPEEFTALRRRFD